jgi:hypothetical protein
MMIAEPVKIAQMVANIFEQLQIPYYVVGSLASSFHGIPRATADADLIAAIRSDHIRSLSQKLKEEFYVDEERIEKAVQDRSSFNVIHLITMFKIDVFIQKSDSLAKTEMARRTKYQVTEEKGQELYLASAEDTVLSKLEWYEAGGRVSERQWIDVQGVLQVCSDNLDYEYLINTARKRKLTDLVHKAFSEAGIKKYDR